MAVLNQVRNRRLLVKHPAPNPNAEREAGQEAQFLQDFRAELERVLASEGFRHSDGVRRLLTYLGEQLLTGNAEGLKEYTIGVEAFNKPADYDPQEDPAVRVLASKLRHKLEEYYLKEGASNPFRLEMPRGHFELRLQPALKASATLETALLRAEVRRWRVVAAVLSIVSILAILATLHWGVGRAPVVPEKGSQLSWTPEMEAIWGPFLKGDRPILISLGTPLFTKFSRGFYRNPRINDGEQAAQAEELKLLQKQLDSPYAVPSFAYTGAGEAVGAFLLGRLLHGRAPDLSIKRSNALSWDDIQHHNMIFVGPPKFNLHLYDLPVGDGFIIHNGAIRNPKPRPGEKDAYRNSWAPNNTDLLEDYALVSRLRGLHGHGEILMLGGSSTESTWAAVEYVTEPGYAKDLVGRVGKPGTGLPDCYQVVIHVKFRQLVPVEISYVTHRVLPPPWITSGSGQPSP